jgi:hypothetical protein
MAIFTYCPEKELPVRTNCKVSIYVYHIIGTEFYTHILRIRKFHSEKVQRRTNCQPGEQEELYSKGIARHVLLEPGFERS